MAEDEKELKISWYVWTIEYYVGDKIGIKKIECNYVVGEHIFHLKGNIPFINFIDGHKSIYVPLKYVDKIVVTRGEKTQEFDAFDSWGQTGYIFLD